MKVQFKTIAGQAITLDLQPEFTVDQIKAQIRDQHALDVEKLIHLGKVLTDGTVENIGIKEGHQVIMMLKKSAPKAAPAPATPAPVTAPQPPQQPAATPVTPAPAAAPTSPPALTRQPAPQLVSTADMVVGPELQATIQQMCEMGFEREQCIRALRAAYNNPDRAMQYLLDGIPEQLSAAPPAPAPVPSPAEPSAEAFGAAEQDDQNESDEGWIGTPQQLADLQRVLLMIRQNPQALQQILQQVGQQRPDLLQVIAQNQDQISALLGDSPPENVVQVTQAEREALDRLMQLGFSEKAVIEAFFACDRDETLAANYLFENQGDDANN